MRMTNDHNLTVPQVENLANELCLEYGNPNFFAWYCGVIYEFGIRATEDLRACVKDARHPGRLFTKIIKDWRKEKEMVVNRSRLHGKDAK